MREGRSIVVGDQADARQPRGNPLIPDALQREVLEFQRSVDQHSRHAIGAAEPCFHLIDRAVEAEVPFCHLRQRRLDPVDRLQRKAWRSPQELQCIDATMDCPAAGKTLCEQSARLDFQHFAQTVNHDFGTNVARAGQRGKTPVAGKRVVICADTSHGEPSRKDRILRGKPGMDRLHHRTELQLRTGRHAGCRAHCGKHLVRRRPKQPGASTGGADSSDRRGGMPAALIVVRLHQAANAPLEFQPDDECVDECSPIDAAIAHQR